LAVAPVITLVSVGWAGLWTYLASYVFSRGEHRAAEKGMFYGEIKWTEEEKYSWYYFLFGFLWIMEFISAMNQFIIASAACIWYFSPRNAD